MIRSELMKMKGYTPLDPVDRLGEEANLPPDKLIKLDGNENPYGCSPRVQAALGKLSIYNLYPDPEQKELRNLLSGYAGVGAEHIVMGAGSDELIDNILRVFLMPGDKVINCPPTFGMYQFSTEVCGGSVVNVRRRKDFDLDIPEIKRALDKYTRVIFIAAPNNPTGNPVRPSEVLELLKSNIMVVVDEAYFEFNRVTLAKQVPKNSNLIVLRTFSKWAGLAGLRVGYGIFPKDIAALIMKIKQPYNINIAAQVAATESLKDLTYLWGTVDALIKERTRLMAELKKLDWLTPYPSKANFILCRLADQNARELNHWLRAKGIFLRYFDTPLLQDCIRITVGKPEQMDAVLAALKEFHAQAG